MGMIILLFPSLRPFFHQQRGRVVVVVDGVLAVPRRTAGSSSSILLRGLGCDFIYFCCLCGGCVLCSFVLGCVCALFVVECVDTRHRHARFLLCCHERGRRRPTNKKRDVEIRRTRTRSQSVSRHKDKNQDTLKLIRSAFASFLGLRDLHGPRRWCPDTAEAR